MTATGTAFLFLMMSPFFTPTTKSSEVQTVACHDRLYVLEGAGVLREVNPDTGEVSWERKGVVGRLIAGPDGLYLNSGLVKKFDPEKRTVLWAWKSPGEGRLCFDAKGQPIFLASRSLTALDGQGVPRWSTALEEDGIPVVCGEVVAVVQRGSDAQTRLCAYGTADGKLRWTASLGNAGSASCATDGRGVYAACSQKLLEFNTAGNKILEQTLSESIDQLACDGKGVLVVTDRGEVQSWEGLKQRWSFRPALSGWGASLQITNGLVFVSAGRLHVLDRETGALQWASPRGEFSLPVTAIGGRYFVEGAVSERDPERRRVFRIAPAKGNPAALKGTRSASAELNATQSMLGQLPSGFQMLDLQLKDLEGNGRPVWVSLFRGEDHLVRIAIFSGDSRRRLDAKETESDLATLDFVDLTGDGKPEIVVSGAMGAHASAFTVFQGKGGKLRTLLHGGDSGPSSPQFLDWGNDGRKEVVNFTGNRYVFSYADGVTDWDIQVWRWNGKTFEEATYRELPPKFQPEAASQLNDVALALTRPHLWDLAVRTMQEALRIKDNPVLRWNLRSLKQHQKLFSDQIRDRPTPRDTREHLNLIVMEVLAGHSDRAMQRVKKLSPEGEAIFEGMTGCETLREILDLIPAYLKEGDASVWFMLGFSRYAAKEFQPACQCFLRARALSSDQAVLIDRWLRAAQKRMKKK